jgi:hypothetical protein
MASVSAILKMAMWFVITSFNGLSGRTIALAGHRGNCRSTCEKVLQPNLRPNRSSLLDFEIAGLMPDISSQGLAAT